jgi:FKBP-type peptidyl-prolyl cis-trans isomerase FkpA
MTCNCPGATAPVPSRRRTGVAAFVLAALAAAIGLPAVAQDASQSSSAHSGAPHKSAAGTSEEGKSGAGQEKAEASYSIGLLMGAQLHASGASKDTFSSEQFMKGFRAALTGTKPTQQDSQKAVAFLQEARQSLVASNEAAASKFLEENAKQPGVKTTPSGLQYKVLSPGSGASPKPADQAMVNYRGTLLDGTEFDASEKHGGPQPFGVGNVIKGFSEGLQLMKPGGKYVLYIPPSLAYGPNSPPGSPIPPGALLKFEVELVSIKPPAPAAGGAMPSPHAVAPPPGGAGGSVPH